MDPLDAVLENELIYVSRFPDDGFVIWKPMAWGKYKQYRNVVLRNSDLLLEVEDRIFSECVIEHNYPLEYIPAGVVTTVAQTIIHFSGFSNLDALEAFMLEKRAEVQNVEEQIKAIVCRSFPAYKFEDLEKLPFDSVAKYLALSEFITGAPFQIEKSKKARGKGKFSMSPDMSSGVASKPVHGIDFAKDNADLARLDMDMPPSTPLRDKESNWKQIEEKEKAINLARAKNMKKDWEKQKVKKVPKK